MKNYIALWITLFTSHCLLANPSTSLEDGSFFDYLTQKAGMPFDGSKLDVNRDPFESLLSKLKQHASFFTAVIPYGRSLQKMAGFPEPLKYPRVVLGSWQNKTELNHLLRGRLFIGYVEPSKKLEIISYNPSLGKFDFQIVENFFPGGKAKVKPAPRNICMKCHRDGMPLFAGGDWLETTGFNKTLFKSHAHCPPRRPAPSALAHLLPLPLVLAAARRLRHHLPQPLAVTQWCRAEQGLAGGALAPAAPPVATVQA